MPQDKKTQKRPHKYQMINLDEFSYLKNMPNYNKLLNNLLDSEDQENFNKNSQILVKQLMKSKSFQQINFLVEKDKSKIKMFAKTKPFESNNFVYNFRTLSFCLMKHNLNGTLARLRLKAIHSFIKNNNKVQVGLDKKYQSCKLGFKISHKMKKPLNDKIHANSTHYQFKYEFLNKDNQIANIYVEAKNRQNSVNKVPFQEEINGDLLKKSDLWQIGTVYRKNTKSAALSKLSFGFDLDNSSWFCKWRGSYHKLLHQNNHSKINLQLSGGYMFGKNILINDMLNRSKLYWAGDRTTNYLTAQLIWSIKDYPILQWFKLPEFSKVIPRFYLYGGLSFKEYQPKLQTDFGIDFTLPNSDSTSINYGFSLLKMCLTKNPTFSIKYNF